MKRFLDLNYHFFKEQSINEIVDKYYANFGYLFYLKDKFNITSIFQTAYNDILIKENLKIIAFKGNTLKKVHFPLIFHKELTSINPDYILVHGMRYGIFSFFLKKKFKNSIILVQVHGYADAPNGIKKIIYKLSSKYIDGFLFTGTENARKHIKASIFPENKVFEVMEGSTKREKNAKLKPNANNFLWVGRLMNKKDPITVLTAFDSYVSTNKKAKLKMVFQSGKLLHLVKEKISISENLKNNVILIGKLDKKELNKLYLESTFFIIGSHFEGSGYSLLESMSFGCIPIISKIPPHEFMTGYGQCGFLFSPKKENELLKILLNLKSANFEEEQIKVFKQFREKLSFEAIANDVYTVFEKLSNKRL